MWFTESTCECNKSHPCLGAWDRHFCFHYLQSYFHCSASHAWLWQSLPPSTTTKRQPAWREEVSPDSDSTKMMVGCRHCQFFAVPWLFEESYSAPEKQRTMKSRFLTYLYFKSQLYLIFSPLQIRFISFSILDHIGFRQAIGKFKQWWRFLGHLRSIKLLHIVARFLWIITSLPLKSNCTPAVFGIAFLGFYDFALTKVGEYHLPTESASKNYALPLFFSKQICLKKVFPCLYLAKEAIKVLRKINLTYFSETSTEIQAGI